MDIIDSNNPAIMKFLNEAGLVNFVCIVFELPNSAMQPSGVHQDKTQFTITYIVYAV